MNPNTKPLIPYGWLRALLFMAFFFLVLMLVQKGTQGLLNLLQQASTGKDASAGETVQGDVWQQVVIVAVASFFSVWVFRTFVDKQSIASLGFAWKGYAGDAWTGFFAAIAMLGIGTLLLVVMKYLSFADARLNPVSLAGSMALMVLVAFSEELFFRGYILNNLLQSVPKWVALAGSAVLFTLVHAGNPGAHDSVLPLIEIFIGGVMLGINYSYTKNLWFGIFLHFGWNFFMGPVLGYEVSGINLPSVLTQNINGPALWTGGAFGFEGSLLSMLLNVAVVALLAGVYEKKKLQFSG